MVPFAGYEMPVQYPGGILAEHRHTRTHASLFDVSHMGQARLHGSGAAAALESLVPVDVIGLAPGRQRYGFFTNDAGGILDDLMVTNAGDHLIWWSTPRARRATSSCSKGWSSRSCRIADCLRCRGRGPRR
jgi:aminomethyltransferase